MGKTTMEQIETKEKAIAIVALFFNKADISFPPAKQCALISIDEQIALIDRLYRLLEGQHNPELTEAFIKLKTELQAVRAEIEKL